MVSTAHSFIALGEWSDLPKKNVSRDQVKAEYQTRFQEDCVRPLAVLAKLVEERREELKQDYSKAFDKLLVDFVKKLNSENSGMSKKQCPTSDKDYTENKTVKLYNKYSQEIFPKVKDVRGSTRVLRFLKERAFDTLESVDESDASSIFDFCDDWDNLIILDACRFDLFQEFYGEGVEKRVSVGSGTPEFIEKTFTSRDCSDTVLITGNPHFHSPRFKDLTGRDRAKVFHTVFDTFEDKFDDKLGTVLPEKIVEDAFTSEKLFPEKRKIIHFMQPHFPFVNSDLADTGFTHHPDTEGVTSVWTLASEGKIDNEDLWTAYKENLEYVWPYVLELAEKLDGKTVVTSDHGNAVGENGLYDHPTGMKAKVLREVPWIEI